MQRSTGGPDIYSKDNMKNLEKVNIHSNRSKVIGRAINLLTLRNRKPQF